MPSCSNLCKKQVVVTKREILSFLGMEHAVFGKDLRDISNCPRESFPFAKARLPARLWDHVSASRASKSVPSQGERQVNETSLSASWRQNATARVTS